MSSNVIIKNIKNLTLLTGLMVVTWSISSGVLQGLLGVANHKTTGVGENLKPLLSLLLVCLLNSIIIIWYTKRSILSGKKLFFMIFLIVFGVMFFMTQIETMYFNYAVKMPWQLIFSTLITGVAVGIVASIFALKIKKDNNQIKCKIYICNLKNLISNIFVLAIIYTVLYFIFGYYIAWQFPLLREYYTGTQQINPFFVHMRNQLVTDPWLALFQVFRGALWAIIGFFAVKSVSTKSYIEKCLLVGFILSIGLCTPLLVPNNFMPAAVRFGHFFEVLSENFLFGIIIVCFFTNELKGQKFNGKFNRGN